VVEIEVIPHARRAPSNHENCFSLSLVEDPAKLWRGWERVGVRVSQSLYPLTSILSPGGERRHIRGYFLTNNGKSVLMNYPAASSGASNSLKNFPPPCRRSR